MGSIIRRMTHNEDGQGIAEYSLILAFIFLACIAAFTAEAYN